MNFPFQHLVPRIHDLTPSSLIAHLIRVSVVAFVLLPVIIPVPIMKEAVTIIKLGLAIGTTIQPIRDFPYQCRRFSHPRLEACEDMWLSEATRQLFLACSDPEARAQWAPNEGHLNLTGRSTRDAIVMMDLETLDFKELPMPGFSGTQGDGMININGFTAVDKDDGCLDLFVTNFRPSVDPFTGQVLADQRAIGGNSTIEVFRKCPREEALEHVRTIADHAIVTPNRVAVAKRGGIYLTNDHGQHKVGWRNMLSPILMTGDVTFCPADASVTCKIASEGYGYPNGLIRSRFDGLIYMPMSSQGGVAVFRPSPDGSLKRLTVIDIPYAIDNLSEDSEGVIWAAVIPKGIELLNQAKNPRHRFPPSSVFKVSRTEHLTYEVVKVLEDKYGELLPGTTTAVHDSAKKRLFLSGVFSPFITICEKTLVL